MADNGIPLHLTYCMMQDSRGFIWFGTMYGLVRYDGSDYKIFKHDPDIPGSISFDDIISIHEDSYGNIWIGTWGGGLNKYDPLSNSFTHNFDALSDNIIWKISEDNKGNLWLVTEYGGINILNPQTNKVSVIKSPHKITDIAPFNGVLLFLADDGIYILNKDTSGLVESNYFTELKGKKIFTLHEDVHNNYWIGSSDGIWHYNSDLRLINNIKERLSYPEINKIAEDQNGGIWAGTFNGLNRILNNNVNSFLYDPQSSNSIYGNAIQDLFFDKSGMLWISSYGKGISHLRFDTKRFHSIQAGYVKSFSKNYNGEIWFCNYRGHIGLINSDNQITYIDSSFKNLSSLAVDGNKLWLINGRGLFTFDSGSRKVKQELQVNRGFKVLLADNEIIYLGTEGNGMMIFNKTNHSYYTLKFDSSQSSSQALNNILSLYKDSENNICIGTYGGLIRYNPASSSSVIYRNNPANLNSISNNYVYSFYEDKKDYLWIGTANGLNRLDYKTGTFTRIYEKDGLPNNVITGITGDRNNNLWIMTNKGLAKFNTSKNIFTNFSSKDGLNDDIFSLNGIVYSPSGNIYAGSMNGINYFNPDSIALNSFNPNILITSLLCINEELPVGSGSIELKPNQNFFTIKFASTDYADPSCNKYRYILEGFDKDWTFSNNINSSNYTNLPPGKYIFRVKGTNGDGIWSSNEARFIISVLPPFYSTWWFRIVVIAALLVTIYTIYKIRLNQKIRLAIGIEKARSEERELIRRKTALDFHDELGHRLTRITLLSEMIKRNLFPGTEISKVLDKISENAHELYSGTRDFIWAIDPSDDSLYELLIRLKDFGDELYSNSDIHFEINGLSEEYKNYHLSMDFRRNLTLIFKEGMNNSLKYANSEKVLLESEIKNDLLCLSLTDFGSGIILQKKPEGYGMSNMKKRAEKISGNLDIISEPGTGTKITFTSKLPLSNYHMN
jgi:ligand-binding sensor domain-containing protein/signal transduction histidine kinase